MKAFHEVRQYDDDFMVWYGAYRDMSFCAHWHEELELIFVRSGSASIHIADRAYEAREGDLLLCSSGHVHYSDSPMTKNRLEFIVFTPRLVGLQSPLPEWGHPHMTGEELKKAGIAGLVHTLFEQIPLELKKKPPYYQEMVRTLLNAFWYSAKRAFPCQDPQVRTRHQEDMVQHFQRLLAYLDLHYQDNLSLEQAAGILNFSQCHFSRLFRQYTGMNFVTYLNMLRVEKALEQLHSTSARIVDVAYNCGFGNIRTFNRVFRQITGDSPTEYLKKGKKDRLLLSFRPPLNSADLVVKKDSYVVRQAGIPPSYS